MEDTVNNEVSNESSDSGLEAEAKLYGWVPKEQFRGNENEWADAATFVQRGKEINPILRKNNETLVKQIGELKKEIAEQAQTFKEFQGFRESTMKREFESHLSALKAQKKEAIELGNGGLVVEIDDAIDALKSQQKPVRAVSTTPPKDAVYDEWAGENPWFGSDGELTEEANALGNYLRSKKPNLQGRPFLDEVTRLLEEKCPSRFGSDKSSPMVEGTRGGSLSVKSGKNSVANLPPEAKKAGERYVKQKLFKNMQEYANEYFGSTS